MNPIKKDLAEKVKFVDKNHGEDSDFSVKIRPLLKTEVYIDKIIYFYEANY